MTQKTSDTMNQIGILFAVLTGGCSMALHFADTTNENKVDIAVLKTRYESIDKRLSGIEAALDIRLKLEVRK